MSVKKIAYEYKVGEEFEPFEFTVTKELNQICLDAEETNRPLYMQETKSGTPIVHPSLLINYSNVTRSPSWYLPEGTVGINAKDEVEFINPGRVGKTFKVFWKVIDAYTKREKPYIVKETLIVDNDGLNILRRRGVDAFVTGKDNK